MIAAMTCYEIAAFFLLYSFIGWIVEVMYHGVTMGKVVNRGFLNGPVCPVYGFGMVAVLAMMKMVGRVGEEMPVSGSTEEAIDLLLMFFGGALLATAVELIAGWALDALFHTRWWDYSGVPFNFKGYICLKFSLFWGLGAVIAVRVVHPILERRTTDLIPERYGWPLMAVLYAIYLFDLGLTAAILVGINKKLKKLDAMSRSMRVVSDELSDFVGSRTITAAQNIQETEVQAALARAELRDRVEESSERLHELRGELAEEGIRLREKLTGRFSVMGRLMKAFPDMKHRDYDELLRELRESMMEQKKKRMKER